MKTMHLLNKHIDTNTESSVRLISVTELEKMACLDSTLILDTRSKENFCSGFIPSSIFIGIDGNFNLWINKILTSQFSTIVVVADDCRINEVDTRIRRTGYNQTILYLRDGFKSWKEDRKTIDTIHSINVDSISKYKGADVLDVRKPREYYSQHLVSAINNPLDYISSDNNRIAIDRVKEYLVYCTSGYRSLIFISMMKARGLHNLRNIKGGFRALKYSSHFELSKYACPTTMSISSV